MRDSVPSPRYSAICNVLRQWKTSLIPTYRVYRLYDTLSYMLSGLFQPTYALLLLLRGSISRVESKEGLFASSLPKTKEYTLSYTINKSKQPKLLKSELVCITQFRINISFSFRFCLKMHQNVFSDCH